MLGPMMTIKGYNRAITVTCIAGILVSTYALFVEMAVEARPNYKAMCDISETISCTKVLSSKYSKGFGVLPEESPLNVPNCVHGVVFYSLLIFMTTFDQSGVVLLQLGLALAANAMSLYLAYLLAFVLHDLCLVCVTTYVVNALLGLLIYGKRARKVALKNK